MSDVSIGEENRKRAVVVEEMLQRLNVERPSVGRQACLDAISKATSTNETGAILDRYYGNPEYSPSYAGIGDPSRPATWMGDPDPIPKTFAEIVDESRPPAPVVRSAGDVGGIVQLAERYHQAMVLLNRARDHIMSDIRPGGGVPLLLGEITEFLEGTK